ncbi:PREDICTED: CASP-like protein 5B3 isoform X2 [Nelumbo nucifera]|uniref:CASP-like protein n=2 Tax=Nelumbo nucifera TaxID=4432 RepID=A0A1U8AAM5_NELNU|nr:PREDICTED: CASP-like protein 5B3 isoform X2 [Nelumbo nucifera]
MKDFPGTPGTLTALILRILQCLFAGGSIITMATAPTFFNSTAFCYLIASMGLQVIWSFGLASLDAYALARKKILHNTTLVTATLSLAAASSAAGVTVLYTRDLRGYSVPDCPKFQMSVCLAFVSWMMIEISSLIMFWLLAAGGYKIQQLNEWKPL